MVVRVDGFVALWLYGFMALWFYGFMVLWLYGFMVLWFDDAMRCETVNIQ